MDMCGVLYIYVCVFSQLPIVAIMGKKKGKKNDEGGEGGENKRKTGKPKLISFLVC
jgi:hypothetical protein